MKNLKYKAGLSLNRNKHGVVKIKADNQIDLHYGMGYAHAMDRGLQLILMRILGQGRACELLDDTEELLEVDKFFRKMNWKEDAQLELQKATNKEKEIMDAYTKGINKRLKKKLPWEFKLIGYKFEDWLAEDTIMLARMTGYVTLAQSQWELERLLLQMIKNGISRDKLEELFPEQLNGLNEELIRKLKIQDYIIPKTIKWSNIISSTLASNNWVVSGKRTASGQAILSNDPHLETNRLPAVWYELIMEWGDKYAIGATMPGLPGLVIGRNKNLSWGATYSFMDTVDSWIEECKDGQYRNGDQYQSFKKRTEQIKRKKNPDYNIDFYENERGILEGDPKEDGYYLSTRWSPARTGYKTFSAIFKILEATEVKEGMALLGQMESSWSMVLADKKGNIGFQMTGLSPRRKEGVSGLLPLEGWVKENEWNGFEELEDLPRSYNPESGFFVTANNDLNQFGNSNPINSPMGDYRAQRIENLLTDLDSACIEDMMKMQQDDYSIQAEKFLKILKPLLPDNENAKTLADWDCRYNVDSCGPYIFEQVYKALFKEVFAEGGIGQNAMQFLDEETGIIVDFYAHFDRVLFSEKSSWFGEQDRDELYRKVLVNTLDSLIPKKWGEVNQISFCNIFFNKKLPSWLGFGKGPYPVKGGRATIHQGQLYQSAGRETSFMPSYRMITDFKDDKVYTALSGGASDRRFSKWYTHGLEDWLSAIYKELSVE